MKKIFLLNLLLFFSLYNYAQEGYIGIALGSSIPLGDYSASSVNFIDNNNSDWYFPNVINGGNGAATSGATLKLLDFHYKFNSHIGIAYSFWGSSHAINDKDYQVFIQGQINSVYPSVYNVTGNTSEPYFFPTHNIGMILSTGGESVNFNLKGSLAIIPSMRTLNSESIIDVNFIDPTLGTSVYAYTVNEEMESTNSSISLGFSIGAGIQYYLSYHWAMNAYVDYLSFKTDINERNIKSELINASGMVLVSENYSAEPLSMDISTFNLTLGIGYVW